MATFTGNGSGTTGAGYYTLKLDVWESYVGGSSENYSTVNWRVNLVSGGYSFADWSIPTYVNVDGEVYNASPRLTIGANSEITIASGSKNIWHDNNGSKKISCSAIINNTSAYYLPGYASCGGTFTLTNIPRYATVYQSLSAKTINTIKMNWSTDVPRDYTEYSVNGGNWVAAKDTVASDNKSGNYTISGLQPNTTYSIKTRVKRTDSQLWSETAPLNITTYDYAKITEDAPNITIGDNATIKYTNPSGASIQVGILKENTTEIAEYREATGTSYTFEFTEEEINKMYSQTENSISVELRYYILTTQNETTYYHYVTRIFTVDANKNKPIFNDFEFADVNTKTLALTSNSQDIVNGYSNEEITISATNKAIAKNYASIVKYKIAIGNQSKEVDYSDDSEVSEIIEKPTSATITVTAIDSRGLQTSISKTANFINYTKPNIENIKYTRENGVGNKIYFELTAKYFGDNFTNTNNLSIYFRYKKRSVSTYSDWFDITGFEGIVINGVNITNAEENNYIPNVSANGSFLPNEYMPFETGIVYDIEFKVTDSLDESTSANVLGSGIPCTAKRLNSDETYSIGINKFPDDGYALDVLGKVKFNNTLEALENIKVKNIEVMLKSSTYSGDLNNINDTCLFYCNNCTNRPIGTNGYLFTQRYSTSYIYQRYTTYNGTGSYERFKTSGDWSEWVLENAINIITDEETSTNEFINNKQVFVKRIDCGTLPNATRKIVSTGLSNIEIIRTNGIALGSNIQLPLPFSYPDIASCIGIMIVDNSIYINTGTDRTNLIGYIDLYYIKK